MIPMEPEETIHFAGTAAIDQPDVPAWSDVPATAQTFGEAFRSLITARTSNVAWEVPKAVLSDETSIEDLKEAAPDGIEFFETWDGDLYATTQSHNAVFSPDLLARMADGDEVDPLVNIPTDSYALVNPYDFYRPLEDAMESNGIGSEAFGTFRLYDRGTEVHGDIWFDTKEIDLPAADGKFKFGINTGYDFKGNRALYANVIAQDTSCTNTLRSLAEKKTRKHVSSEGEWTLDSAAYEDWWAELLEKIDLVADEMNHILRDAHDIVVEFDADVDDIDMGDAGRDGPIPVPFDLSTFYRLAGHAHVGKNVPEYIREAAVKDVQQRSGNQTTHTLWEVHSGLTYALTHVYRGGERGALLQYNAIAKDLLYNPHQMLSEVATDYENEERRREEESDSYTADEKGVATVKKATESISDMREEYDDRQERLEQMLNEA